MLRSIAVTGLTGRAKTASGKWRRPSISAVAVTVATALLGDNRFGNVERGFDIGNVPRDRNESGHLASRTRVGGDAFSNTTVGHFVPSLWLSTIVRFLRAREEPK